MTPRSKCSDPVAAVFPPFQRLPEQIRRDIFQLAARGPSLAAQHLMAPIPITRGNLTLFRREETVGNTTADNTTTQSTLTIDRTQGQHDTYQPLLSLCSESRAETVGHEVFQLSINAYDLPSKLYEHLLRTRLPGTSIPSAPAVPVFHGATTDLIQIPPPASTAWYTADELLRSLSHIFGTRVRRIYLHDERQKQRYAMIAGQTPWRYLFDQDFGRDGMDQLIEGVFPGLDAALGDGGLPRFEGVGGQGEFDDAEAKVFGFRRTPDSPSLPVKVRFGLHGKWEPRQAQDKCYGEVVRHYRGGRTMVNKGLKGELKEIWGDCPTARSQYLLEQVVQLAVKYFPDIESVSVLTLLREV